MSTNVERIYIFKRFERFWHWSQAALIVVMMTTGFEVHGSYHLLGWEKAGDLKAKRDKEALEDRDEVAEEVAERITEAVALVAAKAADELEAFKAFILDIATVTAESTKGVADTETDAIAKILQA